MVDKNAEMWSESESKRVVLATCCSSHWTTTRAPLASILMSCDDALRVSLPPPSSSSLHTSSTHWLEARSSSFITSRPSSLKRLVFPAIVHPPRLPQDDRLPSAVVMPPSLEHSSLDLSCSSSPPSSSSLASSRSSAPVDLLLLHRCLPSHSSPCLRAPLSSSRRPNEPNCCASRPHSTFLVTRSPPTSFDSTTGTLFQLLTACMTSLT